MIDFLFDELRLKPFQNCEHPGQNLTNLPVKIPFSDLDKQ